MMKLSKRLDTVVSMVTKGNSVADVGCDHGFVPIKLVESGIAPYAFALDVRKGPLERASEHIKEHGLSEKITTRLSDGLEKLSLNEADSLVMSGIGGILMMRLLKNGEEVAKTFKEMILSPQSEIEDVRRYLVENGYSIKYEHVLCDEEKYYFIFYVIVKQDERKWTDEEFCYGKDICEKDTDVFLAYLEKEEKQCCQILEKMEQVEESDRSRQRIEQIRAKIVCIKNRRQMVEEKG